jgi:hypothetical protein
VPRMTTLAERQAAQASRIRIYDLAGELWRAIGVVLDRHSVALTYEEVAVALNDASGRVLGYLLAGDAEVRTAEPPGLRDDTSD